MGVWRCFGFGGDTLCPDASDGGVAVVTEASIPWVTLTDSSAMTASLRFERRSGPGH
jgi:hypothetical protein